MNTYLLIYLVTVIPKFLSGLVIFSLISLMLCAGTAFCSRIELSNHDFENETDDYKFTMSAIRLTKLSLVVLSISFTLCSLIPTKKDIAIIYGVGKSIEKGTPDKALDAVDKFIEKYLESK
jgi:hypothetical protein